MNKKKYYLIYQVTNNVNGKIYIGIHETNDLEDDYMGSGKILNKAKEKYKDKHSGQSFHSVAVLF